MTKEKYKISFVIPAYNSENTLEEAVNSIFNGNFEDGDEVIIVNDASTDNTRFIAENICEKYKPFVRLINNEQNRGCPASRNIGIRETSNGIILSLDSDNILLQNSVHKLKERLIEKKADIATFGEVRFFVNNPKKITHRWIFKKGWFNLEDLFSGIFNPGPIGNYLFTKESWRKVNGFSELEKGLNEAWIFTFKQLISKSRIYVNSKGFYYHRYGHESLTIREHKKNNVEERILRQVLHKNMDIFDENEKNYIEKNNPLWIHQLNKRPIKINSSKIGKNGKLSRTIYGLYQSILKKIKTV